MNMLIFRVRKTSPPVSSASIACPGHSAFGEPESTTNPPFIEYDGGSRSNPGLPGEARPSWSTITGKVVENHRLLTSQVTTTMQNTSTIPSVPSSYNFFHQTSMVDRAIRTGKCTSCGGLHR